MPNLLPRLYEIYRWTHPRHHRAAALARSSRRFREAAWTWPEPRRKEWVLQALRATLTRAGARSAFYRARLAQARIDPARATFDDFQRLPILTREELAASSESILIQDRRDPQVRQDATGGSSGRPTTVWKGVEERAWAEGAIRFFMERHELHHAARKALLWGHHLDARTTDDWRARIRALATNATWFDIFRMSPEILLEHHRRLNQLRPDHVIAYAGALAELARVVEGSGIPPRYPRRAFVTGAEKLHRHERERIERVFGVPVLERYGSRDMDLMAFQAAADPADGFEVDWANVLVEPEGEGPEAGIVVTKLHADAFPMIRYRVGDLARFPDGARPGHPAFRLMEILGRDLEMVRVGPDRWLSGVNFPHLFKDYPVADFQVYQDSEARVEVRIVPTSTEAWTEAVTARFNAGVREVLGDTPHQVRFVPDIPRTAANKRRPVISELARRRG